MLEQTRSRVYRNTENVVNERIRNRTASTIAGYVPASYDKISERLRELDEEWDIERTLEMNAAAFSLIGIVLAARSGRNWLIVPAVIAGFLLQHALQGWCPPVPVFRRLGVRTEAEISAERTALKLLRGDFGNSAEYRVKDATFLLQAAER